MKTFLLTLALLLITGTASAWDGSTCHGTVDGDCPATDQTVTNRDAISRVTGITIDYDEETLGADFAGFGFTVSVDPDFITTYPTGVALVDDSDVGTNLCQTFHNQQAPSGYPDNTTQIFCQVFDEDDDGNQLAIRGDYEGIAFVTLSNDLPADESAFVGTSVERYKWVSGTATYDSNVFPSGLTVTFEHACTSDTDGDFVCNVGDDNCTALYNPGQRDDDEDGYGNICDADVNQDCGIGSADLSGVYGELSESAPWSPAEQGAFDINEDDTVGSPDLSAVYTKLTGSPGPSSRSCADCTATPGTGVCD